MTHTIHLIILDIMMPELDGIKTLLKLRESRNIPVDPALGKIRGRGQDTRSDSRRGTIM